MHITDPIADMLTRIRNANTAKHDTVDIPSSKMKLSIAKILLDEGYIKSYELAQAVGIYPSTLSVWLRAELSDERKERVEKALNKLIQSK